MVDVSLSVMGLQDLQADLDRLAKATSGKIARKAVLAGARVARDKAREAAPVLTGDLKSGIVAVSVRQRDTPGAVAAGVRVRSGGKKHKRNKDAKGDPFYWKFLELGTSRLQAAPFIRPSWDSNLARIESAVSTAIADGIDQAVAGTGR
jgi:HK97 gp10 family phage protein